MLEGNALLREFKFQTTPSSCANGFSSPSIAVPLFNNAIPLLQALLCNLASSRSPMNPLTPYPLTPLGCFAGVLMSLAPLPLQLQTWNTGVFSLGLWLAVLNLCRFVNTVVWHDNVNNVAPIWCDISESFQFCIFHVLSKPQQNFYAGIKVFTAGEVAVRACTLVICRRLYLITSSHGVTRDAREVFLQPFNQQLGFMKTHRDEK